MARRLSPRHPADVSDSPASAEEIGCLTPAVRYAGQRYRVGYGHVGRGWVLGHVILYYIILYYTRLLSYTILY